MSRDMKYSGIPWIGDIPKDWDIENIGSCLKEVHNLNSDCSEDNALQFKMGTIISKKHGDSKYNPETLEAYNKVQVGDIVINGLNLSFDFISMRVGQVKENGVITSAYLTVRPLSHLDSAYVTYLFKGYDACKALHGMGKGLRQTLSYKEFRKYLIFHPSLSEQKKIASFLDRKCAEVDEMIALQERIVDELKAYKQSVITEAVTKGLNPDVPMKDSEVMFFNRIPLHWKETKTLRLLKMPITDGPHETPENVENGIPFISADAVSDGYINFDNKWGLISKEYYEECCKKYTPQREDIYMIKSGASTGRTAIVETDEIFTIWSPLAVFRANQEMILPYYLLYVLKSEGYQKQVENKWSYGTQQNIGMRTLEKLIICYPSLEEQRCIVDYLNNQCSKIDSLINIKLSKIESLKEYKKSIIYEYVTGKKEVIE